MSEEKLATTEIDLESLDYAHEYANGDVVYVNGGAICTFVGIYPANRNLGVIYDEEYRCLRNYNLADMKPAWKTVRKWQHEEEVIKLREARDSEQDNSVSIPRSCFPYLLANQDQGSEYVPDDVLFYMRGKDYDKSEYKEYSTCRECGGPDVFIGMDQDIMPIRSWCENCEHLATKDVDPPEMLNEIHAYLEEQYPDWKFITNDSFSLTAVLGKHEIKVEVKGTRR